MRIVQKFCKASSENRDVRLMNQIGKPAYHALGRRVAACRFDCSGLVYYAYKRFSEDPYPRTANEMYHLRDAAPIERSELVKQRSGVLSYAGRGTAVTLASIMRQR